MYDIDGDLVVLQNILMADTNILSLLNLTDETHVTVSKRIIRRSQWNDLVGSDKRLSIYPLPARPTRSEVLFEQMIEIACHVPLSEDYKARQVIARVVNIMSNTRIKGRYIRVRGLPGELTTMPGFYCLGCRFCYYDPI